MTALTRTAQPFSSGKMGADAFLRMIETRSDKERWQLIDGDAFMVMTPPSGWHQRVAASLERHSKPAREDRIELPEYAFTWRRGDLYRGTQIS